MYGDDMKLLRIFSFVCAFIFCLAGCHNTTIEGDYFSDSDGYSSLNDRKCLGYFYVKSDMKWKSVYADVVDDSLNVLRSVDIYKNTLGDDFNVYAQDYESPYLKLSFGCTLVNGDSATYTIYWNLFNTDYPHYTLLDALKHYRIETMLREEKLPLSLAIRLSDRELLEFFSVYYSKSLDELGNHLRNIREYPYLFSDYYLNPLQFAKNFDDLAREFDNVMSGKKKSFEYDSVMVMDNALFAYGKNYFSELPFKTIYGFPKCESKNEGAVLFNEIERSYYKSKPFKCVSGAWQLTNVSSSSSEKKIESSSSVKSSSSVRSSSSSAPCVEESIMDTNDGTYWCKNGIWQRMSYEDRVYYYGKKYEEKYGSCQEKPWDRSLIYDNQYDYFWACVETENEIVPKWTYVTCCHSNDSIQNGHFKDTTLYEFSDYGFDWTFFLDDNVWRASRVVVENSLYRPYMDGVKSLLFISPIEDGLPYLIELDSLLGNSEKDRALIDDVMGEYPKFYYSNHSFVTWEQAEKNIPTGFEIPDTSTWKLYCNDNHSFFEAGRFCDFSRKEISLFWTSQKVDDSNMLCSRVDYSGTTVYCSVEFIKCPVDASIVQVEYVTKVKAP